MNYYYVLLGLILLIIFATQIGIYYTILVLILLFLVVIVVKFALQEVERRKREAEMAALGAVAGAAVLSAAVGLDRNSRKSNNW